MSVLAMMLSGASGGGGFSVTDNFNRANGGLGANWTTINGIGAPQIVSNQVSASSPSSTGAGWTANAFTNNQGSQITLAANPGGNFTWGLAITRLVAPGTNMSGYYGGFDRSNFGDDKYRIIKYTTYTPSSLIAHASQTAVSGDIVKIKIVGTTLTLTVNGIDILTTTDATYASGTAGISFVGNSSLADNFVGSNE